MFSNFSYFPFRTLCCGGRNVHERGANRRTKPRSYRARYSPMRLCPIALHGRARSTIARRGRRWSVWSPAGRFRLNYGLDWAGLGWADQRSSALDHTGLNWPVCQAARPSRAAEIVLAKRSMLGHDSKPSSARAKAENATKK